MASFNPDKPESLGDVLPSREKLMEKYKQALSIAQKAKNARDEAVKENKTIAAQNEHLLQKVKTLESKYGTAEEMLGVLTDQKLKLAMEIDDLKKQKTVYIQQLKIKENVEVEAESFKRQYHRLVKENEDLVRNFGSTEQNYMQLRKEFDELKKENEKVKTLFNNLKCEKDDLDKSFKETLQRLCDMEDTQKVLNNALSEKYKITVSSFKEWADIINPQKSPKATEDETLLPELENLKKEKEMLNATISSLKNEKAGYELEIVDLNERLKSICEELTVANSDRDQMMFNLEKVGLETKQLIDNSEKLTDEIESLKQEKSKQDLTISLIQRERDDLINIIKANEEEISRLHEEVIRCKKINEEFVSQIEDLKTDCSSNEQKSLIDLVSDPSPSESGNQDQKLITKEPSVNSELNQLQEDLQVFSEDIIKYKNIADENEVKYKNALERIAEKDQEINEREAKIESLLAEINLTKEQHEKLTSHLYQCKQQLQLALGDLSQAENIKNDLKKETEEKEQTLQKMFDNLKKKDVLISKNINTIESLEQELSTKESSLKEVSSQVLKFKEELQSKEKEILSFVQQTNLLKTMFDDSKCFVDNILRDITNVKEEYSGEQEMSKELSSDTKLTKQLKDALNSQTIEENEVLKKLSILKEYLLLQLKEKESLLKNLRGELATTTESNKNMVLEIQNLKEKLDNSSKDQETNLNHLQNKILAYEQSLHDKENCITQLQLNVETLIKEKQNDLKIMSEVLQKYNEFNRNISEYFEKHKNLTLECFQTPNTVSDFLEFLNKTLQNFGMLYEEINTLTKERDELSYEKIETKNHIESLLSKIEELSGKISENEKIKLIVEKLKEEKTNASKQIDELILTNTSLKKELSELNNGHSNLKALCNDLQVKLDQSFGEKENKIKQENVVISSLEESIKELRKQENDLQKMIVDKDTLLKENREEIRRLNENNKVVEEKLYEVEKVVVEKHTECSELQNKLDYLSKEMKEKEDKHLREIDLIENRLTESNQVIEKLEKSLAEIVTNKDQLEGVIKEKNNTIQNYIEQVNHFEKSLEELNKKDIFLNESLIVKNTEIEKLSDLVKSLKDSLETKEAAFDTVVTERDIEMRKLNEHIESLQKSLEEATKKQSEVDKVKVNEDEKNDNLQETCNALKEQISSLEKQISNNEASQNVSHEENEKQKESLESQIVELKSQNESLSYSLSSFKEHLGNLKSEHSEEKKKLTERISKLQEDLSNQNELLEFKTMELKENNRIWAGRFSSLKMALLGLDKSRKEVQNDFECMRDLFSSFMNHIKNPLQEKVNLVIEESVYRAKHELIGEMQQMNQALKERGETISKLEFCISENQAKIKNLTSINDNVYSQLEKTNEELKELQNSLKEKDSRLKQLEEENEQLKEGHDNTADTDVLSTSTISRTEEVARLRDVEDSLEDRYTKLKLLAVKMKKRIVELTQNLESEKNKANAEKNELQEKIMSMSMAVKNAQKLQELFDQSLDERDELKKRNKLLEASLEELKNSEEALKNKIASLENSNQNIPVMKKHIDSLNGVIKEAKAELHKVQMENKAENIKYEELKKTNTKLEAKIQDLTYSLDQAKLQGKNNNVLELEIKNYEKIISDLNSQLNSEKTVVKNLQAEKEAAHNMKVGLEEQISILEKQVQVEEDRNQLTGEQLNTTRKKLEESTSSIDHMKREIEDLQKELADARSKNEALALEMSQITSEYSKKEIAMTSRISSLQEQIRSLETSLLSIKQELATSKQEIKHLNEEYESYKLRAQTILAKKKGDFMTHGEKEARDEVERLKKDCKMLEEKVEEYITQIDSINTRLSSVSLEKARSDKKCEEVKKALEQKIGEYDLLNTEYYNFKMRSETEMSNLKDELSSQKREYQSELSHQQKIIEELSSEFKQKEESLQQNKDLVDHSGFISGFQESIPLPLEREDGEGSESVPSPKTRRCSSSIVPLDILLNNPIVDEHKVTVLQEQVEKLKRELKSYEMRCRHLSSLLSETEKDAARNSNQNKVLKEELRRLERSLERHPHLANTEYLKNVIFKFVTLPQGDERGRLVPVLDTILKLSPEETNKLNAVAKGESQAGWGSYLPLWNG